jgi:hypothetical protein
MTSKFSPGLSVAYGPEAMLAVLVLAGGAGLSYSLPVGGAIILMMLAVGVSYARRSGPTLRVAARTSWLGRTWAGYLGSWPRAAVTRKCLRAPTRVMNCQVSW